MPKCYLYRLNDFDPKILQSVPCMSDDQRSGANYVYPWGRTEIYKGVFCAWAKGANVHYQGSGADKLRKVFSKDQASGVYEVELPEPTPPPVHEFHLKVDHDEIFRLYLEGICLLTGAPEDSVKTFSRDALAKIVKVSPARFIGWDAYLNQEMQHAETEQPVPAGDPAKFNQWHSAVSAKYAAQMGFPQ